MDFTLTREQALVRKMMQEFTENEVKPIAAEIDRNHEYPAENVAKLFKLGVMGMTVPKEYGDGLTEDTQAAFADKQSGAAADGIGLFVCSGFRSYTYQASLYNNYVNRDGRAAADTYSARPGHSEHQTGLAIDVNSTDGSMATSPEGIWLAAHCAEYGFIIRYPQGKEEITGYMYEPWHVRYVGKELAAELTENGLTLEEYFGLTSVYDENA